MLEDQKEPMQLLNQDFQSSGFLKWKILLLRQLKMFWKIKILNFFPANLNLHINTG